MLHALPERDNRPQWELIEPVEGSPVPPSRAGHTCVAYAGKIILCALQFHQVHCHEVHAKLSGVFAGSVVQTACTATAILGHSTPLRECGQS